MATIKLIAAISLTLFVLGWIIEQIREPRWARRYQQQLNEMWRKRETLYREAGLDHDEIAYRIALDRDYLADLDRLRDDPAIGRYPGDSMGYYPHKIYDP